MGVLVKYKIEFTLGEITYLGELLDLQPMGRVLKFAQSIQAQITAQDKAEEARQAAALKARVDEEIARRAEQPKPRATGKRTKPKPQGE